MARTQRISLSCVQLDPRHGVWRHASRERFLRTQNYESCIDYFTLFHDVFWSPSCAEILAIGPPFPN